MKMKIGDFNIGQKVVVSKGCNLIHLIEVEGDWYFNHREIVEDAFIAEVSFFYDSEGAVDLSICGGYCRIMESDFSKVSALNNSESWRDFDRYVSDQFLGIKMMLFS